MCRECLRSAGSEILNDVVINQVLMSFGSPALTRAVIDRIQREGVCRCGGTEWHGRVAMRISVSSRATTEEDVDASLSAIIFRCEAVRRRDRSGTPRGRVRPDRERNIGDARGLIQDVLAWLGRGAR